jgi:hypothetical protein
MRRSIALLCALLLAPLTVAAEAPRSAASREARSAVATADLAGQRLLRLLGETRRAGDARRAACVDEKLTEVNSFARMISLRSQRLVAADGRGDRGETARERIVLRNLVSQLRRLEREGRACVEPVVEGGSTEVTVLIAPDTPREDLILPEHRGHH